MKTGEYRYSSVVGLNVSKMHEEIEVLMQDGYLTEGVVTDWVKRQWNRLKEMFMKALAYIKKSLKNALDFLEFEPIVRAKTTVRV